MNKILTLLFLFLSIGAFAQTETPQVFGSRYYEFKNTVRVDSGFLLPRADTVFLRTSLKAPGDIRWRPADSLLYYYTGALWSRLAKHSDVANGVTLPQLNDTLTRYLTFNTRLTPLASGANLPIQPTDSLTQALAKLQAQINAFIGQFVQLNPLTSEPGAAPKITGTMSIKNPSGSNYLLSLERTSLSTEDISIGFRTAGNVVARVGMINQGLNHMTIDNLYDKVRFGVRDSSHIDMYVMNPDLTGYIFARFGRKGILIGDSISSSNSVKPQYPVQITSAQDTSLRADHKIVTASTVHAAGAVYSGSVTGVTETLSDNSTKMASTAFVKGQGYLTPTITGAVTFNSTLTQLTASGYRSSVGGFNWDFGAVSDGWGLNNTGVRGIFKAFQSDGRMHLYNRLGVNNPTDDGGTPLIVNGATASPGLITSGNLTLNATHSTVVISNAAHALTLPTASSFPGRIYHIVNDTASPGTVNTVRLNGVSGVTAIPANAEWTIQSINSLWYVIQE